MGSLGLMGGGKEVSRNTTNINNNNNNAMWVYPKMMGANPSERWGHSACYFNGLIYIFGVSLLRIVN